jgi:Predicted rRNA methylase
MIQFPRQYEAALLGYVKSTFYRGTKRKGFIDRPFHEADLHFFAKGLAELSGLFTLDRAELNSGYLNQPPLRAAYLLYFLPINYAKNLFVLQQVPELFWSRKKFRVLDLGAGPGSAALAFLHLLSEKNPEAEVELTLSDQNKKILEDARQVLGWEAGVPRVKIQTLAVEARRFRFQGSFDLILMSHVLNEWVRQSATERAEWLAPQLLEHLAGGGIAAVTEPALKRPTRELMALRDHLLETGELCVLAPCLHQQICPMLAATHNDWCHFYVDWIEPEYLQQLDRLVNNDNRFLKVAYLLLGKTEDYAQFAKHPRRRFRVVSNRMTSPGKTEGVLCGPPGRIQLSRSDRDRSEANRALDEIRRGDLVEMEKEPPGYETSRQIRLGRSDKIKKL